jgi:hypothetical protein
MRGLRFGVAVSHISRKTSEIWGTPIRGQDGIAWSGQWAT